MGMQTKLSTHIGIITVCLLVTASCSNNRATDSKLRKAGGNAVGVTDPGAEQIGIESETLGGEEVPTPGNSLPGNAQPPSEAANDINAVKHKAFETTVYPLLTTNCANVGCHSTKQAPLFAVADIPAALLAANGKIDFVDPTKSQLVIRLSSLSHYCWSGPEKCIDDSKEMAKVIESFKAKLTEAGIIKNVEIKQTTQKAFATAVDGPGEPFDGTYVQYAAGATLVAPMAKANLPAEIDSAGSVAEYIESATAAQGTATFTFKVTQAGMYTLWTRSKIPTFAGNNVPQLRYNVSITPAGGAATPPAVWNIEGVGASNSWIWDRANPTLNSNVGAIAVQLPVGDTMVVITGNTAVTKINRLALTTVTANFQGGEVVGTAKSLTIPANEICGGKNVSFKAEVSEYDAKNKVITIRNLRIITDTPIYVKSVDALINGKYNPLNTAFRIVDETIMPPGKVVVRSALQAVGDAGFAQDKLSFAVEKCEPK